MTTHDITQLAQTTTPEEIQPAQEKAFEEAEHAPRPVYSIVAPVFNEEETLPHFYQRLVTAMEQMGESFELLLINDGSRDRSYHIMQELHERDPRVHAIDFSRNFGHQIAIFPVWTTPTGRRSSSWIATCKIRRRSFPTWPRAGKRVW